MVMDILYYAKGRELVWEPISAPALLDDVCQFMEPKLKENGIECRGEDGVADGKFEGDIKALRSLLIDLMANSLDACRVDKKKDEHYVSIGFGGDQDHIVFKVADNGIGMDREDREKVFTLFFSSKGLEGTGLGLFIANKVAQAHGGSISVESEPGAGARFVVKLPRKPPPAHRTEPAIEEPSGDSAPADTPT
jgi:signal transduction histidine kinase